MGFVIATIVVILIFSCLRVVPQATEYVIERLGKYKKTWDAGLHFLIPVLDRVSKKVTLKEQVLDSPPQPVINKDNVTMQIDTVVYFKVFDAKLFTYGAVNPISALSNLAATTLRNIVGELELDDTLTSRDTINGKMTEILDDATDQWGIKVNRVELKNIIPPTEIQNAMEKQMKAERERREAILRAEGEKASNILVAQGKKESKVLEAEAEKQAAILFAEAEKEARIKKAEAEAEAILKINQAQAESSRLINEAKPEEAYLTLKKLEAFEKASDGQATKIIVPSDLQGVVGLVNAVAESAKK